MKKTLIALAVAGTFAAPAFAATSNVDIYGVMSFAVEDGSAQDLAVTDRVSRFGLKGSEDLGGGLSAIWQIEQQIEATANNNTAFGGKGLRNTFVGLKGAFGTAVIGRHDTPYKMSTGKLDPFADTLGDYNAGAVLGLGYINAAHDYRSPQAIAYLSPNFSGFSFAAAVIAGSDSQVDKTTNPDNSDAFSASFSYENGPLFATLAYQKVDRAGQLTVSNPLISTIVGSTFVSANATIGQSKAWKAGIGYAFGNLKVGALYEQTTTKASLDIFTSNGISSTTVTVDGNLKTKTFGLNAVYQMGNIALKGAYMRMNLKQSDLDIDADAKRWILGADYSLSKRTTAYVAFNSDDRDDQEKRITNYGVGVKHSF